MRAWFGIRLREANKQVDPEQRFLADLAVGIVHAGGPVIFHEEKARTMAAKVLDRMREIGPFAYPSLLDEDGLRFVYQWDENPPLVTVMLWNEYMWQDMSRVPVPKEIDAEINQ